MINKRAQFATLAVATAVALGVVVGTGQSANGAQTAVQRPVYGMPACRYEDGHGQRLCYWDARTQGNGKGWSFVAHNGGQYVTYVISAPQSCQALANLGSWKSRGSDGVSVYNGRTLAGEMMSDARTFKWSTARLSRNCAGWLYEYGRDTLR